MIVKGKRLYSILFNKCPRCHNGKLFKTPPYNLMHFTEMNQKCDRCNQSYLLEPSFYSGAMYVSHALQVALVTTVSIAIRILFGPVSASIYIIAVISAAVLLLPVNLRLSRSIYINFFVSYQKQFDTVKSLEDTPLTCEHASEKVK